MYIKLKDIRFNDDNTITILKTEYTMYLQFDENICPVVIKEINGNIEVLDKKYLPSVPLSINGSLNLSNINTASLKQLSTTYVKHQLNISSNKLTTFDYLPIFESIVLFDNPITQLGKLKKLTFLKSLFRNNDKEVLPYYIHMMDVDFLLYMLDNNQFYNNFNECVYKVFYEIRSKLHPFFDEFISLLSTYIK